MSQLAPQKALFGLSGVATLLTCINLYLVFASDASPAQLGIAAALFLFSAASLIANILTLNNLVGDLSKLTQYVSQLSNFEGSDEVRRVPKLGGTFCVALHQQLVDLNDSMSQIFSSKLSDSTRLLKALEVCQANVMVANNDMKVVYANNSIQDLLRHRESVIRSALPSFDSRKVVGSNVDIFHANPAHQRRVIDGLKQPHKAEIKITSLTIDLIATPIFDDAGVRIGTVVELTDKTEKLKKEATAKKLAQDNARIRKALDVCQANVMMADNDFNVVYFNQSLEDMLRQNQTKLRAALPKLDVDSLEGTCIDVFHCNPSHQRNMVGNLKNTMSTDLNIEGMTFNLIVTPVFDDNMQRIGTVVEWKDQTEKLADELAKAEMATRTLRIKRALDVCQTNVMVADADYNIVYLNESLNQMFKHNEYKLRRSLPNLNVDTLVGTSIDMFHRDPLHQRRMLADMVDTYVTTLSIEGLTLQLTVTPVFDDNQNRTGTVVEWLDQTQALAEEKLKAKQAADNLRIRSALDVCQANVMMADEDFNIVYLNESLQRMLEENENTLRQALPDFNVKTLVGNNVDFFHKNPAHQRQLVSGLTESWVTDIKVAGITLGLIATPVIDSDGNRLGTVVELDDKTQMLAKREEELRIANENARVRQALDAVTTNTMIADANNNIVYLNKAINGMMGTAESDIRKDLPNFKAKELMGANMDVFHKNPAHQKGMISKLVNTFEAEIEVGGRTFSLIATPVFNQEKERIGTVVEWGDRTKQVKLEQTLENEINALVEAAIEGDLSLRVNEDDKDGLYKRLANGLNRLVTISEKVIGETSNVLDGLANGDLNRSIESEYKGSFDKLKQDANSTVVRLKQALTQISEAADMVALGADEITRGNADLSARTENQAASLEETASSMDEMTSTVQQNAENATRAKEVAVDASGKAKHGGEIVDRAIEGMESINASSKQIADIIGVIDEIAFQTNLLALNASVEAARAGEQGRGFAVVAGEVRNLAGRSAGAAKEIKELITDSVSRVDEGSRLVLQSGEALQSIVDTVNTVNQMVGEIEGASKEQSTGIVQVNGAISNMDQMTQQNAALVEQAAAASESMAEQARNMKQLLSFFNLRKDNMVDKLMHPQPKPRATYTSERSNQATRRASAKRQVESKPMLTDVADNEWEEF